MVRIILLIVSVYQDYVLFIFPHTAPTEVPSNVSVSAVNATTLHLSWTDVISNRGLVREYIIRVVEIDTGLITETHTNLTFITIHVHPAYLYNCSVSAVTVAHGPFTEEVSIVTPMAGKPTKFNSKR